MTALLLWFPVSQGDLRLPKSHNLPEWDPITGLYFPSPLLVPSVLLFLAVALLVPKDWSPGTEC